MKSALTLWANLEAARDDSFYAEGSHLRVFTGHKALFSAMASYASKYIRRLVFLSQFDIETSEFPKPRWLTLFQD